MLYNINSRISLIKILLLYKYNSYDYRVIFFMSKCVYIFLGHSVFKDILKSLNTDINGVEKQADRYV